MVSHYQNQVYSVAMKLTGNPKDAEDITQEVFIQAYRHLTQFKFEASFSTWLYKITLHKGLDWKRKNKRILEVLSTAELMEDKTTDQESLTPEELFDRKAEGESVRVLLSKLPESYQAVVTLYYYENLSYQQIAEKLGIAKKTVESRLYRAKIMLKESCVKEGLEWIAK